MASKPSRTDAIRACCLGADELQFSLFVGNGYNARCAASESPQGHRFFMVGSMGLCAPLAAGFSRFTGVATIAVEGDGNALMGLSGLPVAVSASRAPFVHVVLDNEKYETTGGQATLSTKVDLSGMARAAGYDVVVDARGADDILNTMRRSKDEGLKVFILVKTRAHDEVSVWPRVAEHPLQITKRFVNAMHRRDGAARSEDIAVNEVNQ